MLAGHVIRGAGLLTVTVNAQVAVAPPLSLATQVTVVVPLAKFEPLGGEQTTLVPAQLSVTTGWE